RQWKQGASIPRKSSGLGAAESGAGLRRRRRQTERSIRIVEQTAEDRGSSGIGGVRLRQRVGIDAFEKDAVAAAYRGPAIAEYVPSEAQAGAEIIPIRS